MMALNFSQRLLDILVENSLSILREHFGLDRAEGAFFEVIDLIREDPRLKTYFLEKVEKTLLSNGMGQLAIGEVPRELIELAVFEFKWPEFAELARRRIEAVFHGDKRLALGDVSTRIEKAYLDEWDDKEFYRRYNDR